MTIFGMMAAVALSGVYSYITQQFLYANPIFTLLFSLLLGTFIGGGAKIGKVRNIKLCSIFAIIISIFAVYMTWVIWFNLRSEIFYGNPKELILAMNELTQKDSWQISGVTVKGIYLWLVWFTEATIIIGLTCFLAHDYISMTPFCEKCKRWANEIKSCNKTYIKNTEEVKSLLEKQDFSILHKLRKIKDDSPKYSLLMLVSCPSCKDFNLLTITNVDGQQEVNFVEDLYIPRKECDVLFKSAD